MEVFIKYGKQLVWQRTRKRFRFVLDIKVDSGVGKMW